MVFIVLQADFFWCKILLKGRGFHVIGNVPKLIHKKENKKLMNKFKKKMPMPHKYIASLLLYNNK